MSETLSQLPNIVVDSSENRGIDSYTPPPETLSRARQEVLSFLAENDIDPKSVVFSGYDPKIGKPYGGEFDEGDGRHSYYFGTIDSMSPPSGSDSEEVAEEKNAVNPIIYAIRHGALGIYSLKKLRDMASEGSLVDVDYPNSREVSINSFHTVALVGTPVDIEGAKIRELHFTETNTIPEVNGSNDSGQVAALELAGVDNFRALMNRYGLTGSSERERQLEVANMNPGQIAVMLTAINSFVRGKDESDISEETMKIGGTPTIAPEDRAEVFINFINDLQSRVDDISPERFGDALALATVLLHPFNDGNGRTARLLGFIFRDDDSDGDDFYTLIESRDYRREKGGFMVNGYIPRIDGDRSDPKIVSDYLKKCLNSDEDDLYTGPYGQANLAIKQQ